MTVPSCVAAAARRTWPGPAGPSPAIWLPWHQSRWAIQQKAPEDAGTPPWLSGRGRAFAAVAPAGSPGLETEPGETTKPIRSGRSQPRAGPGWLGRPSPAQASIWPIHVISTPIPAAGVKVSPGSTASAWAGRYWPRGPQHTPYVPAPMLRQCANELIVLEPQAAASFVAASPPESLISSG
jgi:hypothetical protein